MTQKKKLVLSSLPEQTDDYSRYEQTETRWDRIITVVVILALLIGVLIYVLVGNGDEENDTHELNTALSEERLSVLEPEGISVPTIQNETNIVDELTQETEQSLVNSKQTVSNIEQGFIEQVTVSDSKLNEISLVEGPVDQEAKQVVTNDLSSSAESESIVEEAHISVVIKARSAQIKIENSAITRAILTLGLKDKEPKGTIPYDLVLPDEGIAKVILFTEMQGLRGKKLYHDWYRNGVRQARVKIPVNANTQNSHSSKYINAQMLGEWQVKVVDEKSELYVLADFRVVLP
tara:strand:+ start:15626 stop:16498 length:873 start_codon:yes stop_codon:yes gene_type:complete